MSPLPPVPAGQEDIARNHGHLARPTGSLWWELARPSTDTEATGTPVVLLHGGPGMPAYYLEPLVEPLVTAGHPVLVFDQIGCGRSPANGEEPVTVDSLAADVLAVIAQAGLTECVLYGHSWGGMLALETYRLYAERRKAGSAAGAAGSAAGAAGSPTHIRGLVLGSPLLHTDLWLEDARTNIDSLAADVRALIDAPRSDAEAAAGEDAYYREYFCALDPWPAELEHTMNDLGTEVYEALWGPNEFTPTGALVDADSARILDSVDVPVLALCGTRDEVSPKTLRGFTDRVPGERGASAVFEGGTHCVHLEQPEAYVRALTEFLGEVPDARGGGTSSSPERVGK